MKSVLSRISFVLFVCALASLLPGCGSSGPATATVEGTITYNNQPVTEGNVIYENAERGLAYVAPLDAAGHYLLKEVLLADYKVCIRPIEPKGPDETGGGVGVLPTAAGADPANIPKEFRSAQTTRMKATVVEGSTPLNYDLGKP